MALLRPKRGTKHLLHLCRVRRCHQLRPLLTEKVVRRSTTKVGAVIDLLTLRALQRAECVRITSIVVVYVAKCTGINDLLLKQGTLCVLLHLLASEHAHGVEHTFPPFLPK